MGAALAAVPLAYLKGGQKTAMGNQIWIEKAWEQSAEKTLMNLRRIGAGFPHASKNGVYELAGPE